MYPPTHQEVIQLAEALTNETHPAKLLQIAEQLLEAVECVEAELAITTSSDGHRRDSVPRKSGAKVLHFLPRRIFAHRFR
jgi:hypothetical protein